MFVWHFCPVLTYRISIKARHAPASPATRCFVQYVHSSSKKPHYAKKSNIIDSRFRRKKRIAAWQTKRATCSLKWWWRRLSLGRQLWTELDNIWLEETGTACILRSLTTFRRLQRDMKSIYHLPRIFNILIPRWAIFLECWRACSFENTFLAAKSDKKATDYSNDAMNFKTVSQ